MTKDDRSKEYGKHDYGDLDPHYYRRSLRADQAGGSSASSSARNETPTVEPGQRVQHPTHGVGTVKSVTDVENRRIAVVDFDDGRQKKVNLGFASLDILNEH